MSTSILSKSVTILIAEDDEEDRMLTADAMRESRIKNSIDFVEDGEVLMDYLLNRGEYADKAKYPAPGIILLDLNMPRKDGREALREIKSHDMLKRIPVVILTTSKAEEDIIRSYDLGVNSFITKPVTFEGLIKVMSAIGAYWFDIVELPVSNH
ncbi:MAG: response regulator [Bacteroidota bacterium]|jgi:CheY-like chemotaxis protein